MNTRKSNYTSLLPRWLANRWSRARTGNEYRTYTYSRRGYVQLLEEAGFKQADFYCPYPDYREFDRIVPVTTRAVKQLFSPTSAWKRAALQLPFCAQLLRLAVPSFSIVASNVRPATSRLHRIVNDVSNRIGMELETPADFHSRPIGEVFAYCAKAGDVNPTVLLRVAETQTAIDARLASARHLDSLWNHCDAQEQCMDVIPRSKGHGHLTDGAFTVEEIKPGISWRKIDDFRKTPGSALLTVGDWLTKFQISTKPKEGWEPGQMQAHVAALADDVRGLLPERHRTSSQRDGVPERDWGKDSFEGIPVVVCHGDLHLDNVLFLPTNKKLTGVIDWDLGEMRGLPLTDLMYLLLVYGMEVKGQTYSQTVRSILNPVILSEAERKVVSDYEAKFALDEIYRAFAIQVMVLQNIVTLFARRPEAFKRLENDLNALPDWLWRTVRRREDAGLLVSK